MDIWGVYLPLYLRKECIMKNLYKYLFYTSFVGLILLLYTTFYLLNVFSPFYEATMVLLGVMLIIFVLICIELRNQISAVLYLGGPGADRLKMAFSMCELENVPTVSDRKGEALFYADGLNTVEPVLTIVPFVDLKTKQEFLQVVRNILPNY